MGGLTDTLSIMAEKAVSEAGSVVRVRLAKKLTISFVVKREQPDILHVQLARDEACPSLMEWRTVIKSLPRNQEIGKPLALTTDRFYLKGKVRLLKKMV